MPPLPQVIRLRLLEDADPVLAPGRVEDPAVADPEGDVVDGLAVRDEVSRAQLPDLDRRLLLLVGVARDEPPEAAIRHVDEAGAVDAAFGHAAPDVRRAEVGTGHVDRRARGVRGQLPLPLLDMRLADPAGVSVGREDAHPPVAPLLDAERLAAEGLRHLLRLLARLGADRSDFDGAPHPACLAIFVSSIAFTRGQSSSTTAYHAESRIESDSFMCFRKMPSKLAPTPRSAPRTRRLRASVLNSTRIAPHCSNAFRSSRYFVSMFAPVPHCGRASHVQPISTRLWNASMFMYRVEPTGRSATCTTNGTSFAYSSAVSNHRSKPSEGSSVYRWMCGSDSAASRRPSRWPSAIGSTRTMRPWSGAAGRRSLTARPPRRAPNSRVRRMQSRQADARS